MQLRLGSSKAEHLAAACLRRVHVRALAVKGRYTPSAKPSTRLQPAQGRLVSNMPCQDARERCRCGLSLAAVHDHEELLRTTGLMCGVMQHTCVFPDSSTAAMPAEACQGRVH